MIGEGVDRAGFPVTDRSMNTPPKSLDCLIIGAGIAGLVAAWHLQRANRHVLVVEKSRGVGGRMATRRLGPARFDHGCQFFTARAGVFQELVREWTREGLMKTHFTGWDDEGWAVNVAEGGEPRYTVVGGMTAVPKHLASALMVETEIEGVQLRRIPGGWQLLDQTGLVREARQVLVTAPVPQALALLEKGGVKLPAPLAKDWSGIAYDPCFALMLRLGKQPDWPSSGFRKFREGPLDCLFDNARKGVSAEEGAVTIHSSGDFAREHFEEDPEKVMTMLREAARPYLGPVDPLEQSLRRWKYAKPRQKRTDLFGEWKEAGLFLAGDGFGEAKVEGAVRSGWAAAEAMLRAWTSLSEDML